MGPSTAGLVRRGRVASHFPWAERLDPYHETSYNDLATASWSRVSVQRHRLQIDSTGQLAHVTEKEFSPLHRSDRDLYGEVPILIVAALHQWGQLTAQQLCCMLGVSMRTLWRYAAALYAAGVVKRMTPRWQTHVPPLERSLLSLDRTSWTTARWEEGLDQLDHALVTNGVALTENTNSSSAPTALRHNLITSEICLKAMEVCPGVVGAWGEAASLGALLDSFDYADSVNGTRANIGDAVIVDRTGKLIVLEVTSTRSTNMNSARTEIAITEKAAMWTAICGRTNLDVSVIFVEAASDSRWMRMNRYVGQGVRSLATRYVTSTEHLNRGQRKIFTVNAQDWFPYARTVSRSFRELSAHSIVSDRVVPTIADGKQLVDRDSDTAVNTLASLHTPAWIVNRISDSVGR